MVIVSTASPYKFPNAVLSAIEGHAVEVDGLDAVKQLQDHIQVPLPKAIKTLFQAKIRHNTTVQPDEMQAAITKILKIE